MRGWVIVPKGTGDVQERVEGAFGGRKAEAVALTVYLDQTKAQTAFTKLPAAQKVRAELLTVEVTLNPDTP